MRALQCIHAHLEPGGHALIPLEAVDVEATRRSIGHWREATDADGRRLRCGVLSIDAHGDGRNASLRLRYERAAPDGEAEPEVVERSWERRWWSQAEFGDLVAGVGFEAPHFLSPRGGPAATDDDVFVVLLRKP